jgi:hypothetical protein
MTGFLAKYGKIALALVAIFLSGQVMGWMLALHSCEARPPAEVDSDRWSERMMSRLQDDLQLSPEQVPSVRGQLDAVSSRMKGKRDAALFQIHLELIKLHDDLAAGLNPAQQKKLAESRRDLVDSTEAKFPELLRGTTVPPDVRQPAKSTAP